MYVRKAPRMPENTRRVILRALLAAGTCALIPVQLMLAQSRQVALDPTRTRLVAIRECLGPDSRDDIEDLGIGLLVGWNNLSNWTAERTSPHGMIDWSNGTLRRIVKSGDLLLPPEDSDLPAPPPQAYLDSLDRDLEACTTASTVKEEGQRSKILESIARDIKIKARDCMQFGMGRTIEVRVSTMRGKEILNGWEAFYKWLCASGYEPKEMSIPGLTSPAVIKLPPGEYVISAQLKTSDNQFREAHPKTIQLGESVHGDEAVECQLLVP